MRRFYLYMAIVTLMLGCTASPKNGKKMPANHEPQPSDTLYTVRAAMGIFAYQPERALQILDSAVVVGNISKVRADICRARIYSMTQMGNLLDSLLGGPKDIRLDTAQVMGERLLSHDSVKADLLLRQDVLETLAYAERMQNDTTEWLRRLDDLVKVCRKRGAETDVLRTEAEIGSALYAKGQQQEGMAKLDSVIMILSSPLRFNELDALIIALKRKIVLLGSHDKDAETLPLARKIIECLDDYEAHPDAYHDGSHREPKNDEKRADYIRFYRSQAQNFLTAAYASLGERGSMMEAFGKIERSVREATIREHQTRYNALQQQVEAERQRAIASEAQMTVVGIAILALLFLAFAVILFFKNRTISRKNRLLAQQITESLDFREKYLQAKQMQAPQKAVADPSTLGDEQLFLYVNEVIVREKLFLDPKFERQTIMDRFHLSKERVGNMFSRGSEHANLTSYVQQLRLEYAAQLLTEQPDKGIGEIAADCGFSSHKYFTDRFRQHYSMTPTEFRKARL